MSKLGLQESGPLLVRLRAAGIDYNLATVNRPASPVLSSPAAALPESTQSAAEEAWIRPAKVHPAIIAEKCSACAWSLNRTFAIPQGFGVRIRALTAVSEDAASAKDLLQLRSRTIVRTTKCLGDISSVPVPHVTQHAHRRSRARRLPTHAAGSSSGGVINASITASPTGNLSLQLKYTGGGGAVDVGCFRQRFAPSLLNLTDHRPLRVALWGDGSGATLVLQLEDNDAPFFRTFFVHVTWHGWRTVRLDAAATRELFVLLAWA